MRKRTKNEHWVSLRNHKTGLESMKAVWWVPAVYQEKNFRTVTRYLKYLTKIISKHRKFQDNDELRKIFTKILKMFGKLGAGEF